MRTTGAHRHQNNGGPSNDVEGECGMKVLISGASGLIGSALQRELHDAGHQVATLVRGEPRGAHSLAEDRAGAPRFGWDPSTGAIDPAAVEWADAVVNLSGAPIAKVPWTRGYQMKIAESRVNATRTLAEAIARADSPPRVFLTGTGISYYGGGDEVQTESSPQGAGFLAEVVHRWEAAAEPAQAVTRVAFGRTGLVLASGGVMTPLVLQSRLGFGGRLGAGDTVWPWISLRDEVAAMRFILENEDISGPVNLAAPVESTSGELTQAIASALGRPHWFHVPRWVWEMAFPVSAEETMFTSQRAVPDVLLQHGFKFRDTNIAHVVGEILGGDATGEKAR